MPLETQLGMKNESTYGTAVTVDRFTEYLSEKILPTRPRLQGQGLRTGQRVERSDRTIPINKGAAGPIKLNPLSVGWGWWLVHMLGTVSTGALTDSAYTHTGVIGSLFGDMFTMQANRYDATTATNNPFTWEGGKVASWELSNAVDGILEATYNCDFEDEKTATALASASYPAGGELFSWAGGAVTIGGNAVPVVDFKIACDNGLKTDRHHLRGSTLKKQPVENKFRKITWDLTADFDSLTDYNRFVSSTAAGSMATIVATWTAPTLVGVSAYPTITVTIDNARFDAADPSVQSDEMIMNKMSGVGLFDGTDSAVTIAYKSTDATP